MYENQGQTTDGEGLSPADRTRLTLSQVKTVERLNRMEMRNRLLTLLVFALAALVLICLQRTSDRAIDAGTTIEAHQFVIKDREGRVRGALGMASTDEETGLEEGNLALVLMDENGVERIRLAAGREEKTRIVMRDTQDTKRVDLVVKAKNTDLLFCDENGVPRIDLGSSLAGPMVAFFDTHGRQSMNVGNEGGRPSIKLYDEGGQFRAILYVMEEGPVLLMYDDGGKMIWGAP